MRRLQNVCLTVAVTALIVFYAAWSSLSTSTTLNSANVASAAPDNIREHSTLCQVSLQVRQNPTQLLGDGVLPFRKRGCVIGSRPHPDEYSQSMIKVNRSLKGGFSIGRSLLRLFPCFIVLQKLILAWVPWENVWFLANALGCFGAC